jgi:hypothetical protein
VQAELARLRADVEQLSSELAVRDEALALSQATLTQRKAELAASLEREAATGGVLRAIASAPADVQGVLDVIVKTAVRLCGASAASIGRVRPSDGRLAMCANAGPNASRTREQFGLDFFGRVPGVALTSQSMGGRAFLEQRTTAVDDRLEPPRVS